MGHSDPNIHSPGQKTLWDVGCSFLKYLMINPLLVTLIAISVLPIVSMGTTRLIQSILNNSFPSWIKEHLSQEDLKSVWRTDFQRSIYLELRKQFSTSMHKNLKENVKIFMKLSLVCAFILSLSSEWILMLFFCQTVLKILIMTYHGLTNIKTLFHTGNKTNWRFIYTPKSLF